MLEALITMLEGTAGVAGKWFLQQRLTDYAAKRRVSRAVDTAIDQAAVELDIFLQDELARPEQRELLVAECDRALRPLVANPETLFQGSLDGQRVFSQLYPDGRFPQPIIDEGLGNAWALFVPRAATVVCGVATSLKDWQREAWRENYRRLDDISAQLRSVREDVDNMSRRPARLADRLFEQVLRLRRQRQRLLTDLAGLGDASGHADLDAIYVYPALEEGRWGEGRFSHEPQVVGDGTRAIALFLAKKHEFKWWLVLARARPPGPSGWSVMARPTDQTLW